MVSTLYWLLFGAVVVYLYVLIARERARRDRIRRLREFRQRRALRDAKAPQRWL